MTLKVELADKAASDWTDITDQVRVYEDMRVGGNAHLGEVGTGSGFDLDDDAGDVTLPVKRVLRIRETATSPDTILVRGRIAEKNLARGGLPIGDARAFDVQLDDGNVDLRGIPIRAWSRPAETDYQRVIALWRRFLKGKPRASTRLRIDYVRNANRVNLPKQTYRDTDPYGVLADVSEAAGKEFFVTADGELFWDLPVSTRYAASLSITDDDPNMTDEFPPIFGVSGDHDGSEFLSGAVMVYGKKKRLARVRSNVEDAHDFWRQVIPEDATGATDAAKRMKALLSRQAREDKTYSCAFDLTEEQVDMIKYGQTVSFRSAAAGVTSPAILRVGRLMWEPLTPGRYRAHLELGFPKKLVPRIRRRSGSGGGSNAGNPTVAQGSAVHPPAAATWLSLDDFERTIPSGSPGSLVAARQDDDTYQGLTGTPSEVTHTVPMPAGIAAGDLCLVSLSMEQCSFDTDNDVPSGWTLADHFQLFSEGTQLAEIHLLKVLDGTETEVSFPLQVGGDIDPDEAEVTTHITVWRGFTTYAVVELYDGSDDGAWAWDGGARLIQVQRTAFGFTDTLMYESTGPVLKTTTEWDSASPTVSGAFTLALDLDDEDDSQSAGGWGWTPPAPDGAPWEGPFEWQTSEEDGSVSFHVTDGRGVIELGADDSTAIALLASSTPEESGQGPWGPWSSGHPGLLYRLRFALGDTAAAAPNVIEIGVYDGESRPAVRIHLGDAVDWSYMDPDEQRGIILSSGDTDGTFVPLTLEADTDYYLRLDFTTDTLRAKLWLASEEEPDWQATLAREYESGLAQVAWLRLQFDGNEGMDLSIEDISVLSPDPDRVGYAGEVYGLVAVAET